MNVAPDHEAIIVRGARTFVDDAVAADRYWTFIADAMRTLRREEMNEKGVRRCVNIAIARANQGCPTCDPR